MRSLGGQELSKDEAAGARSQRARATASAAERALPEPFARWFAERGWRPRPHQLALLDAAEQRRSTLLIAPTGAGKTLAGFLPSLVSLAQRRRDKRENKGAGLHTLYISPLKALAVDVARNVMAPIAEMGLPIRTETRTGDTPVSRRQRQRVRPPDILMTTPEQLALLLSHPDCGHLFADLDTIILDELHALAPTKRGDLLALDIARLRTLAPNLMSFGLSATVARPSELRAYLVPQRGASRYIEMADVVRIEGGAKPQISILEMDEPVPWAGHTTLYALSEIYDAIERNRLSLVFVNTRMQAELLFQELWRINDLELPIALHHGSLDTARRRKVEAAMAAGTLKAVVATSTLDLGIDWGDVDLVIHVGAPKGASRFIQRIGRSNHRLEEPSRRSWCRRTASRCSSAAQHSMRPRPARRMRCCRGRARSTCSPSTCSARRARAPFEPAALYKEVVSAAPYAQLTRAELRPRRRLRGDRRLRAQNL